MKSSGVYFIIKLITMTLVYITWVKCILFLLLCHFFSPLKLQFCTKYKCLSMYQILYKFWGPDSFIIPRILFRGRLMWIWHYIFVLHFASLSIQIKNIKIMIWIIFLNYQIYDPCFSALSHHHSHLTAIWTKPSSGLCGWYS